MQTTVRYRRRCGANTDQWREGIWRDLPWRCFLIELALTPLLS